VTTIKWKPWLGCEIFKIENEQIRDICFLKFGNTVQIGNCLNILFALFRSQTLPSFAKLQKIVCEAAILIPLSDKFHCHIECKAVPGHTFGGAGGEEDV
jgi:hypothetical protein